MSAWMRRTIWLAAFLLPRFAEAPLFADGQVIPAGTQAGHANSTERRPGSADTSGADPSVALRELQRENQRLLFENRRLRSELTGPRGTTGAHEVSPAGFGASDRPYQPRAVYPGRIIPGGDPAAVEAWTWQLLPDGLLWKSFLAGPKEPRISGALLYDTNRSQWVLDTTLGGRVGILRFGTSDSVRPEGWQLDVEGAAFPRLNVDEGEDLDSVDFRLGVPLTWRRGPYQFKFAYYHLSSHVGDEFLKRNPDFRRINFSRNALVLGVGYFPIQDLRLYAETGYGFLNDGGNKEWEFQFGFDYAPAAPTGLRGSPFLAMNVHLRQEVDYGGGFNTMAGWAWRGARTGHLFRAGLQYFNGKTSQYEFFQQSEQLIGFGIWYDY